MAVYDFECDTCGHRVNDVIFAATEYDDHTLKGKSCDAAGCPGHYEHTFEKPASFSFKGGAPTPRFGK